MSRGLFPGEIGATDLLQRLTERIRKRMTFEFLASPPVPMGMRVSQRVEPAETR